MYNINYKNRTITYFCDTENCGEEIEINTIQKRIGINHIVQYGWMVKSNSQDNDILHYCPDCAEYNNND